MHADDARYDGVACAIEDLGAGRRLSGRGRADRVDVAVGDDDGLIFFGCGSCTVDDTYVIQDEYRRVDGDKGGYVGR